MEDATEISAEAARDALLAGGDDWRAVAGHLAETPELLRRSNFVGADLSERDLSSLDLSHCDFYEARLTRANLKKTVLAGAELAHAGMESAALYKAQLTGAILQETELAGADLSAVDAQGADFRGADLRGARFEGADLRKADFSHADLTDADLSGADVTGAKFHFAQLAGAKVTGLRYGTFRDMVGLYLGVRGLDQCWGNALFTRDAKDEDYIDTLYQSLLKKPEGLARSCELFLFRLWGLIDHGRSLLKVAYYATILALAYGFVFMADMTLGWGLMDYSNSAQTWFTPFYYSVVTYTTLGYGDVHADSLAGEMLVISEVIVGYFTLGLLLAILANTIARRS